MRYDRDIWRRGPRSRADLAGRREYGEAYEGPYLRHGWSEGFLGGDLRSRGSWRYPRTGDEFAWGDGYIGGRGYGGTNYDLEHGYATGSRSFRARGAPPREGPTEFSSPAARGGYAWGEEEVAAEEYGPARYGYGPYYDRLRRRRRSDDDLRQEVEDTLFYDTWVDADAISISVEDGVVTLRGTLTSYDELRYAVDDAWDVDGVRGVRSEMQVNEEADRVAGRYEPGAPHMHGHPRVGEAGASGSMGRSANSETERGRAAGGRQGGRSESAGATSAPPTGAGLAATRSGSSRAARGAPSGRASGQRRRSGAPATESRRGRGSASGGTASGFTSASGTELGESAAGAGEGGTDVSRS